MFALLIPLGTSLRVLLPARAQTNPSPPPYNAHGVGPGYPGDINLTGWGNALVPLIEGSLRFKALAGTLVPHQSIYELRIHVGSFDAINRNSDFVFFR